jgi:hypothetical protein
VRSASTTKTKPEALSPGTSTKVQRLEKFTALKEEEKKNAP